MIIGIDLGTTNSLAAVWRNGQSVLIPNALGQTITPSAVAVDRDGQVLVGMAARERLSTHASQAATAFKRYMGTDRVIELGRRSFRPEELSALVLGSLKSDAEAFLGDTVSQAVITVPAYFNEMQRKATKVAGQLAGLRVDRLLTEPTAAALAYGVQADDKEELVLVIDLGGGTFDVSLLHRFEGVMEVRAAAGDSWLGGEDFVDVIVDAFLADKALAKAGLSLTDMGVLRRQAELAKRTLSTADVAAIEMVRGQETLAWTLTRERFESLSEPILARVRVPIERALRDARVRPEDLNKLILAGGASRMPMLRRLIGRLFRRLPMQQIDPDEVVARGAGVRAGMSMHDAGFEESVMIDVAPFSLGIEVSAQDGRERVGGLFLPIIERNSPVPSSRSDRVLTTADRQKSVQIAVYQGESRLVKENLRLGQFDVGVPPGPAGAEMIDVRLTVDTSGLLEVEAQVVSTGVVQRLVIESEKGALSPEEIESRLSKLAALKRHPREDAENIALMARAGRLYEQRLGGVRDAIGQCMAVFQAALESQDPDRIRQCGAMLTKLVETYDDPVFL
ncbi:MAG TPA: molecular chaperone HscC [Caulobacteraceae bacterium]|nr:molecular chaperone HscC [Caulobacteraceae bacterium]